MIRVLLYLPGISRSWAPVDFLLDTGAGTSVALPVIVPRLAALFRTAPSMMTEIAGVPLP
jgi:hypothetical protein